MHFIYYHIAILCTCMIDQLVTLAISEAAIVVFSNRTTILLFCKYSYILRHLLIIVVVVNIAVDVIASCM